MKREQVLPHVMADMAARIAKGADEYGEPLTTNNGRKPLQDAYEEVLDLALYLKQELLERAQLNGVSAAPWSPYGPSRESIAAVTSPESAAILADVPVIQGGWPGPDWSQAPEWANYWMKSATRECSFWLECLPNTKEKAWYVQLGRLVSCSTFGYAGDWRDSLRKRPETPKCEHKVTTNNLIGALTNTGWHCRDCGMHVDDIRKQQQGK